MVVAPFLVLFDPDFLPVPMLLVVTFLSLLIAWCDRKDIDLSGIKSAVVGRLFGNAIAVWLITAISEQSFMIIFGTFIIIAVILSLFTFKIRLTTFTIGIAGVCSGLMGTLAALGGPPMAILYQNEKGGVIRSTLSGYFVLGAISSLIFLGVIGKVNLNDFLLFLYLLPGVLVGFYLSRFAVNMVDRKYLRKITLSVSLLAGALVIAKALISYN